MDVGVQLILSTTWCQGYRMGLCVVMTEIVAIMRKAVRCVVTGYIVVIVSVAMSSVVAMSQAVTKRSVLAAVIVVARLLAVVVWAYTFTRLTH